MEDRLNDIRARLEGIAEELTDLALDRIRQGLEGSEAEAVAARNDEKRLARARRAVEKAAALLG